MYIQKNVFFEEDSSDLKYVFDLEKSCLSPRSVEVVRAVDLICLEHFYNDIGYGRAKIFMDAYNGVYPISKSDFRNGMVIYFLKTVYSLWIANEHYIKGSNRVDCFLTNQYNFICYFNDNLDSCVDNLFK